MSTWTMNADTYIFESATWRKLDHAAVLASGNINDVCRAMEAALQSEDVEELCMELGLLVTSFVFRDVLTEKSPFYEKGKVAPTYRTKYLWPNSGRGDVWDTFVHNMFVTLRTIEKNFDEALSHTRHRYYPDYLRSAPIIGTGSTISDSRSKFPFERMFREQYYVHYCSVGEMTAYILLWRLLSTARDLGLGEATFNGSNILVLPDCDTINHKHSCKWLSEDLIAISELDDTYRSEISLREVWGSEFGPQRTWLEEWGLMGLADPSCSRADDWGWVPLSRFCSEILNIQLPTGDPAGANIFIQQHIHKFMEYLDITRPYTRSVEDLLHLLETKCRFPIFPFYAWSALDKAPKTFCVSPVWISPSPNHTVDFTDGSSRALGLAISGCKPLVPLDITIQHENEWQKRFATRCTPQVVFSLLRMISTPLVEESVYSIAPRVVSETAKKQQNILKNTISKLRRGGRFKRKKT